MSPAGTYAYVAYNDDPGGLNDANGIEVLDLAQRRAVANIPIFGSPTDVAISPDGSELYVSRGCNEAVPDITKSDCPTSIAVVSTKLNRVVKTIGIGESSSYVTLNSNGKLAYIWTMKGLTTVNLATDRVERTFSTHQVADSSLTISRDGKTMFVLTGDTSFTANGVSGSVGPDLLILNLVNNRLIATVPCSSSVPVDDVVVSSNGKTAYESVTAQHLNVVNAKTGRVETTIPQPAGTRGLELSPDGRFLYAASNETDVDVIETTTNEMVGQIAVPDGSLLGLNQLGISGDGQHLFVSDFVGRSFDVITVPPRFR